MLQRKQTLFLLAVVVLTMVGVFFPLGNVEPSGMGVADKVYSLCVLNGEGGTSFATAPLFAVNVLTFMLTLVTIFMYSKRPLQARLCMNGILLQVAWYCYFAFCWTSVFASSGTFHPSITVCLPLLNVIFFVMARQGIIKDEKLVRSMDRIR